MRITQCSRHPILKFNRSKANKFLDKLSSLSDLGLFNTNTRQDDDLNLNNTTLNCCIEIRYFLPHNFQKMKSKLSKDEIDCSFLIFHNNVSSINRI